MPSRLVGPTERLAIQARVWAPAAARLLDTIGVGPGWVTADLGCGPVGILDLLSRRVGRTGAVFGVEANPINFLAAAERFGSRRNVRLIPADARRTPLPRGSFDLVHARLVCQEAGARPLIREMLALARPGGWIVLEEPAPDPWTIDPSPADYDRLAPAVAARFLRRRGGAGPALPHTLRALGAVQVSTQVVRLGFRGGHPYAAMPRFALEVARPDLIGTGRATAAELDRLARQLGRAARDPAVRHRTFPLWQVWARRPRVPKPSRRP